MDKTTNHVPLVLGGSMPMETYFKFGKWGSIPSAMIGFGQYFLQANFSFPHKLIEAMITTVLCGLAGGLATAAGKYLWDKIATRFFKTKQK